jgi:hypothetical protein
MVVIVMELNMNYGDEEEMKVKMKMEMKNVEAKEERRGNVQSSKGCDVVVVLRNEGVFLDLHVGDVGRL